jgi:hypothetical protein
MSTNQLTDAKIQLRRQVKRPTKMADGRGLYLLVNPNGTRYWRFKYRFANRENSISFGVYPEVSINAARKACEDARALLRASKNPSHERKLQKNALLRQELGSMSPAATPAAIRNNFEQSFIMQHGPRPGAGEGTDFDLMTKINAGKYAELLLAERREWDTRRSAAQWAWLTKDHL